MVATFAEAALIQVKVRLPQPQLFRPERCYPAAPVFE